MRIVSCAALALASAASFMLTATARADIIELFDGNSSTGIDTGSSAGMFDWIVDGVDQANQQWFWFREGTTGPESSIDTLFQSAIATFDTNPFSDDRVDTLSVLYEGNGFEIEMSYTLRGGTAGSGVADIAEQIVIRNTGMQWVDMQFFQYADFDLGGTAGDDTVEILGGNTARQTDGNSSLFETVVTPTPIARQAGVGDGLITSLTDGGTTTLNNEMGPLFGDANWAFQWDIDLAPGHTFIISKDKLIAIPAPAAGLLLAPLAFGARRRRRG